MGEHVMSEILAQLTGLNTKVDASFATIDANFAAIDARFNAIDQKVDKLRTELSERLDSLSDQVKYLRDDSETSFHTADRAIRINADVTKSLNDQLSSMVRQIRTLESRLRIIEDDRTS